MRYRITHTIKTKVQKLVNGMKREAEMGICRINVAGRSGCRVPSALCVCLGNSEGDVPMFWIFPYFFESRILECFPTFSMLDYQVFRSSPRSSISVFIFPCISLRPLSARSLTEAY